MMNFWEIYRMDDLQSSTKVLARLPTFQYLSRKFISSPPSPRFNVAYRDELVIARFQHCWGGGGEGVAHVTSFCLQKGLSTHFCAI